MSQERTEAIVLRGVDFSETSRVVTFLTPDRGRFACMAKGVRRKNSPLAGALDTLNRIELVYLWKDERSVQTLCEASLLDGYTAIKKDLEKSVYAAFPAEIAGRVAHENEPSRELYDTFVRGMESLAVWTGSVRAHACWQVIQLLGAAGFEPMVDTCAECGRPIAGPAGFSWEVGVTCVSCRADQPLTAARHGALCALVQSRDACPSLPEAEGLFGLLQRYAARQLEAEGAAGSFRSARIIEEMFGRTTR